MSKLSSRKLPKGLFRLKSKSRQNPATVGGRTRGIVRIPSSTARAPGFSFMIFLAQNTPRKKANIVAATPVFKEIHKGLQFISLRNSPILLSFILQYLQMLLLSALLSFQQLPCHPFSHHLHKLQIHISQILQ